MSEIKYQELSIAQLARVVRREWKNVWYGAEPYLQAMSEIERPEDSYGHDSGASVVRGFLVNAQNWRGQVAREVKKELNRRLKGNN